MSSDEETGYGSIEITPKVTVESTTSRRRRGVAAVVAALALFGLVVLGGSSHSVSIIGSFMGESVSQQTVIENGIIGGFMDESVSQQTVIKDGTRKTVTALIKIGIGYSHKPRLCEDGSYSRTCRPGLTLPPTDAPTSKPTASPTDAPGFLGRLFGN